MSPLTLQYVTSALGGFMMASRKSLIYLSGQLDQLAFYHSCLWKRWMNLWADWLWRIRIMHRYLALGQESDQIEDHLIIRLSTAVTNFLLMQDAKFHVSSQISRVRCCVIKNGRKRYKERLYSRGQLSPPGPYYTPKKGKRKGISHCWGSGRDFFPFQGRKSTKGFAHQQVMWENGASRETYRAQDWNSAFALKSWRVWCQAYVVQTKWRNSRNREIEKCKPGKMTQPYKFPVTACWLLLAL